MPNAAENLIENAVTRWTVADLDDWIVKRLNDRWPGRQWQAPLQSYSTSNDCLFIKNDVGVMLFTNMARHIIHNRPVVIEVFAFCRHSRTDVRTNNWVVPEEYREQMYELYRHALEWGKGMKAARVIFCCCSDVVPSALKLHMRGGDYLVDIVL